jgi:AraC-like DNA-binding protein
VGNKEKYYQFRISVPDEFGEVFSHFYFAENKSSETVTKILLPSYQTILIFNFGTKAMLSSKESTQIEIDKCLILGTIKKAFEYSLPPQSKILVANFRDDAFYRFFGMALLAGNLPLNPDELLNENCLTALWHDLDKISNADGQVDCILEFCKPYLQKRSIIAEQLTNFKEQSINPVKAIADKNNQSERNIQINHKKYFGYSAKEINRYHRFLKALEYIENILSKASKEDWFEIISECGYYDQSQLINDFQYYIGICPTKYLKFQKDICNPI